MAVTGNPTAPVFSPGKPGEVVIPTILDLTANAGSVRIHPATFHAFYVDHAINFIPGSQYWTQVAQGATFKNTKISRIPLNPEVAYLFTRFTQGNLDHFDDSPGSGSLASANELQRAMWSLQPDSGLATLARNDRQAKDWIAEAMNAGSSGNGVGLGIGGTGPQWTSSAHASFEFSGDLGQSNAGRGRFAQSAAPSPVPLPASFWAILGLIGILLGFRGLRAGKIPAL